MLYGVAHDRLKRLASSRARVDHARVLDGHLVFEAHGRIYELKARSKPSRLRGCRPKETPTAAGPPPSVTEEPFTKLPPGVWSPWRLNDETGRFPGHPRLARARFGTHRGGLGSAGGPRRVTCRGAPASVSAMLQDSSPRSRMRSHPIWTAASASWHSTRAGAFCFCTGTARSRGWTSRPARWKSCIRRCRASTPHAPNAWCCFTETRWCGWSAGTEAGTRASGSRRQKPRLPRTTPGSIALLVRQRPQQGPGLRAGRGSCQAIWTSKVPYIRGAFAGASVPVPARL